MYWGLTAQIAKELGLSQKDLSENSGVSLSTINRLFNNRADIPLGCYIKLLKEIGIDLEKLLTERLKEVEKANAKNQTNIYDEITSRQLAKFNEWYLRVTEEAKKASKQSRSDLWNSN